LSFEIQITNFKTLELNKNLLISLNLVLLVFLSGYALAQQGGKNVYEFMNLSNSARVTALGSNFLTIDDGDIDLAYANPSLINEEMSHQISLNYLDYFSGINAGFVSYGQHFDKVGTFVGSLQFINYGTFDETDETGQKLSEFSASEYAFIIGWSKALSEKFRLGVNLKNIYSSLDEYSSYGLAADVAISYSNKEKQFASSLILKNMGRQISTYTEQYRESLPFQIQMGMSKKFEHAPFRVLFLLNNLQTWNLKYSDPNSDGDIDPFTGEEKETSEVWEFADNALRHAVLGVEFVPGKGNFMVRLAYNYRRQQEMRIASRAAMVGFSFGFGLRVYKFKISYSRASYHLAGGTNTITMGTNFSDLFASKEE